jgi:predicted peptidase
MCIRLPGLAILILIWTTSPASVFAQYGLKTIGNTSSSAKSGQKIASIKSLENELFDSKIFIGEEMDTIHYRLYIPTPQNQSKENLPLVIVFHSSAAIGIDNNSHLGLLAKLFASPEIQKNYPAYILAPQFPTRSSDYVIDSTRNVLVSTPRKCLHAALHLIDSLKQSLHIDSERIYSVGFSMGGSTAINALSSRPDLFAGGISIAGIPEFNNIQDLSNIPIWLIHGTEDIENPIDSDEIFFKEISHGNNVLFWRIKNTDHNNVFTGKLLGPSLPKWLFKHRKT